MVSELTRPVFELFDSLQDPLEHFSLLMSKEPFVLFHPYAEISGKQQVGIHKYYIDYPLQETGMEAIVRPYHHPHHALGIDL